MNFKNGNKSGLRNRNTKDSCSANPGLKKTNASGGISGNLNGGVKKGSYCANNGKNVQKENNHLPTHLSPGNFTFSSKFSSLLNLKPQSPTKFDSKIEKVELSRDHSIKSVINPSNSSNNLTEYEENEKKLKDIIQTYCHTVRKNEGAGVNTLFKIRTVLLNWLKDSEQDNLEYTKFMTEKKIKYLLKNKEKMEAKVKLLESELNNLKTRKVELEPLLEEYASYETEELEQEIERFANSWEIRTGKSKKMMEMFEEKKKALPLLKEFNTIKEQEVLKTKEKNEMEKICKNSCQTLGFLSNYYKNLRKKIDNLSCVK